MTLAVFPIIEKASTAEATSLPSTTTLTMTTGSESADLSLLVSNASGTFSSSSSDELAKFSIATNNYTGYTLTIAGSDDTGLLTNTDTTITSNNTFSSIDTAISETTFDNSIYNGKWGYLPSKYSSVDNTSFRPAPTTTASTLNVTNCANDTTNCPDTEDDYTIGLGIRADYTKPVGTYTNTFILTATANPVGYSITYADNTGDSTVTNIPAIQSGVTSSTFVTLNPDKTPIRTGYTFKSWCLGDSTTDPTDPSTIVTNNGTICHGTEYTAGESADFVNQTIATSAVTLYAVWDANTYSLTITFAGTGVSSVQVRTAAGTGGTLMGTVSSSGDTVADLVYGTAYYLYPTFTSGNEFSSWTKTDTTSGASISSTTTANPTYTIGLGDGAVTITGKAGLINYCTNNGVADANCMQKMTVSISNCSGTKTDARDGKTYTVATINNQCWMTKNLDLAGGTTLETTLSNVANTYTLPASSTSGFSNDATAYVYNSSRTNCSSPGCYSYYSYAAATAGTNPSSGNATSDICPKGWRLPTQTELNTLKSSYSTGAKLTASPFLGVYGGYYLNSSFDDGGSVGNYWSSTAYSSTSAYFLYFGGGSAGVNLYGKRRGYSVRCVFGSLVPAMQDFTKAEATAMSEGDTRTLRDLRDNQEYSVAKIGGTVWMTKNLNIAGGTTLTSATSNVSSDYTLPASSTSGFSDYATAYVYNSGRTDCSSSPGCYSYYSYVAATAGTNLSSGSATSDICPKGWRLPTQTEFNALLSSYDTAAKLAASPFLAVYGGRYYESSFANGGKNGYYWSSTAGSSTNAYYLSFVGFNNKAIVVGSNKRVGISVRCVKS